jgi:hypothetical protein
MSRASLKEVVQKHRGDIMKLPGVIGVGVGLSPTDRNKRCILVYTTTSERPPDLLKQIDGYDVEIVKKKKGFRAL